LENQFKKANVFIATPCYEGNVSSAYVMSLLSLQRLLMQNKIGHDVCLHSDSLITRARNNIASRFLREQIYSHLLFIDADIAFDPATVLRYLAFDRDVVAGIYPIKELNVRELRRLPVDDDRAAEAASYNYSSRINMDEENLPEDGFARVDYAASGFMMIKRKVLEVMAARYPELEYRDDFTGENSERSFAFFDTLIHNGQSLPEDYSFCKRWKDAGGEVWGDVAGRFDHIGRFVYSGHVAALALRSLLPRSDKK
jgi:hypothetical protein